MKKFILIFAFFYLNAQDFSTLNKLSSVFAIELTDGNFLSDREITFLRLKADPISEMEEMIYSPNTHIICIKLTQNQKKFSHHDEIVKLFYDFLSTRSYLIKSSDHAQEIYEKYHNPQANIDKIKIK